MRPAGVFSSVLSFAFLMMACGNEIAVNSPDSNPSEPEVASPEANSEGGAEGRPGQDGDVVNPSSPESGTQEKYQVTLNGGSGSGFYAPGETVTVWSGVSTQNKVVLPWSGDSLLLEDPAEWITHFIMTKKDAVLQANVKRQELALKVETYTGSTKVAKDVRYFFPENMKGLVFISHGTGGTSKIIEKPKAFAIALALV